MMLRRSAPLLAVTMLALAGCQQPAGSAEKTAAGKSMTAMTDAQRAYMAANARMHAGMATVPGDPDVAFMQGMAAHHQGAIEMADVALKYAKDPEVIALAERVKQAQTGEIAEMQAWLDRRGVVAGTPVDAPSTHDAHKAMAAHEH